MAETFPPASVGSTVDTYLILYGQCGCPESAGNAVAWTDPKSSRMSASCVRYGRKVARLCATAERLLEVSAGCATAGGEALLSLNMGTRDHQFCPAFPPRRSNAEQVDVIRC